MQKYEIYMQNVQKFALLTLMMVQVIAACRPGGRHGSESHWQRRTRLDIDCLQVASAPAAAAATD